MKAIVQDRYGSADVLELREVERPAIGDDEVLVRVQAAGVDPSVWHLMTGRPYLVRAMGLGVRRPKERIRGLDLAGVVEAVGSKVTAFAPGDEVFGGARHGSFAEFATARPASLGLKPPSLTFEEAAAMPVSGCPALQAVRDVGRVAAGQRVLVIGAGGGVGSLAVQIAKAFGAEVTGLCGPTKLELVRDLGAATAIDYTRDDFTDGRRTYHVVVDTAGRRPLRKLRRALAPKGVLVLVGGDGGDRVTGGFLRQLRAPLLSRFVGQDLRSLLATMNAADLECLRDLIETGKVRPIVDRTYPLAEAAAAIRHLGEGHSRGKAVLVI